MAENKEMENGVISEEALDQIAGGLSINKSALKKAFIGAGVAIAAAAAGGLAHAFSGKKGGNGKGGQYSNADGSPYMSSDDEDAWHDHFSNKPGQSTHESGMPYGSEADEQDWNEYLNK
ncbi:MAG: hypothetical protein IJJ04_00595 [Clostridia bacterium]|nr:hypothetical protein [Clostridia bacterium]